MAMLLRQSGLGGLLRRTAAPLSASRKATVPPSIERHYGNARNGTGSAKESSKKKPFVENLKALTKELLERYWAPLSPGEKLISTYAIGMSGFLLQIAHTTESQTKL